jgi:SAM-dependent methyltransferase
LAFTLTREQVPSAEAPRLPLRYVLDLLKNGITPIRAVSDAAIRRYLPFLYGARAIYELGGASAYYKNFVPNTQPYKVTGLSGRIEMRVDMTDMPFDENSLDALFSAFALEHVFDYKKGVDEIKRVIAPGGRILIVVPFLYYYHAAPDDYVRFSPSYLEHLFEGWHILSVQGIGTRSLFIAEMLFEKPFMQRQSPKIVRLLLRLVAAALVLKYIWRPHLDSTFPSAVLLLAEKPSPSAQG